MGPTKAKRRYSLIQKVQNLLGLSENPRMLGFIAALDEKRLQAVRKQDGVISAADLYRLILDEWLQFEVIQRKGGGRKARLSGVGAAAVPELGSAHLGSGTTDKSPLANEPPTVKAAPKTQGAYPGTKLGPASKSLPAQVAQKPIRPGKESDAKPPRASPRPASPPPINYQDGF